MHQTARATGGLEIAVGNAVFAVADFLYRGQRTIRVDVAGAAAISQLRDAITDIRILVFFVRTRLEIARVTTGAVWLVSAIRPGDHGRITDVAIGAVEIASVFTWKRR